MTHKSNVGSQKDNLDDVIFYLTVYSANNFVFLWRKLKFFLFIFESNLFLFDFYFSFDDLNRNLEEIIS